MARGEQRDDDLVEGQRERQHASREQRAGELRQQHVAQGLQAIGAEIHRGLDETARQAPEARDDVVVDDDEAERGVAEDNGPEAELDARELEGGESSEMPVTMPGSAIGSTSASVIASLPQKRLRARPSAASDPSRSAASGGQAATPSERPRAAQMSGRAKASLNQCSVRPGGGNW